MRRRRGRGALAAALVVLLSACGGDGGGSATTTARAPVPGASTSADPVPGSVATTPTTSAATTSTVSSTTSTSVAVAATTSSSGAKVSYTYSIAVRGAVHSTPDQMAADVASTFTDPRGWSLGGHISFRRVPSGGDFTIWLAQASQMTTFSADCSVEYSCRVGRNVIINDDRWTNGSPTLHMSVADYRHLVINHEAGHWLGLGHRSCSGPGNPAYVMQQQSKGGTFLGQCVPNAWPLDAEKRDVARPRGIPLS